MPVPNTIQQLRSARAAHKAWFVRAEAMVNGLPVDQAHLPVTATNCGFGKWVSGAGSRLIDFSVFSEIEGVHAAFHRVYTDIYKLLLEEPKSMTRLFGKSKKLKKNNQLEAGMLLSTLQSHYDNLMALLEVIEKDYLVLKQQPKQPMEELQTKSFRDVSKMMDDLEKNVDEWLK